MRYAGSFVWGSFLPTLIFRRLLFLVFQGTTAALFVHLFLRLTKLTKRTPITFFIDREVIDA